ncbi:MAG: hypothetical protein KAI39_00665, partial [Desulfobulbaceae bacterium]|nr:hypothetical protein [Desulfobulbaceae bacterium]
LQEAEIQYKTASLIEYFSTQPEADAASTWHLLEKLQSTTFVTNSVLGSLPEISVPTAALLFPIIDQVKQLGEAGKWASKALLEVNGISYSGLSTGLAILATLTNGQNWAAERFCQIAGIDEPTTLRGLGEIHRLSFGDSWSSRSIFLGPETTPESALFWLTKFFILPEKDQENSFLNLPKGKKAELLAAYAGASEKLIWQINNLHDVTDDFGREIGNSRLKKFSFAELRHLFKQLDKTSQKIYLKRLDQAIAAGEKNMSIRILHLSTERARKESARKLTSGNIYVLLAQGNDLYDSSFREILVPVLQQRMAASFQNDLLTFLLTVDPGNSYSSNFITNLAHKGKLTGFLPETLDKQKKIIDLVAESAFHDQNSLILFSATFIKLLQLIDPKVRSYLIDIMLTAIKKDNSTLSSQLQVILQHYIGRHREILPVEDRIKISGMIQERGEIHIEPYTRTPFAEWLRDNVLQSLSVFQRDDDGIGSFFSYCRALIKKGYRPSLSEDYKLAETSPGQKKELTALLTTFQHRPENNLNLLFRAATKMPIVIDWKKELNGTEINHSIFVYRDETIQQELIAQFLLSGHEMFAQRGHSYWRYEQLIAPFEALWKTEILHSGEIWKKQRFLSIGSCGGIKVYRELNKLFRNKVDILATVGTGKASINNPYNIALFEIVATGRKNLTWDDVTEKTSTIFSQHQGGEYLQPASLPAILHKMTYTATDQYGTD